MDAEIKTNLLKALRGNRYKQACGEGLYNGAGQYCCLGVLARIQGAEKDEIRGGDYLEGPKLAKYAAGLRKTSQRRLARMNDGGDSFKEIADYIEKHYK